MKRCCSLKKFLAKLWKTLRPFHSAKGGHPGHLGERTAGAADWTRWLQAQRYLRVCTHRQWQDSGICHTCHTGELPTISFGQDMHTTCVGSAACVCVKKEHVERLFRWTEDVFYHQVLMERVVCEVRALAVLPTKELTQQVRIFLKKKSGSHNPVLRRYKCLADMFQFTGFQSVHNICWGNHSESGDAGWSEDLCCRTSFALRTQVSTTAS